MLSHQSWLASERTTQRPSCVLGCPVWLDSQMAAFSLRRLGLAAVVAPDMAEACHQSRRGWPRQEARPRILKRVCRGGRGEETWASGAFRLLGRSQSSSAAEGGLLLSWVPQIDRAYVSLICEVLSVRVVLGSSEPRAAVRQRARHMALL